MKRLLLLTLLLGILVASGILSYHYFSHTDKTLQELVLYGNVDVRQVDISFRVAGQISELFFEEGDRVKKGDLMALIDKSPYDSQVRQAEANLKVLKANFDNATTLLKRRQELIADGGISLEDLNNAQSTYDQLLASLNASEASLSIANDNLHYIKAHAPNDGIVLSRIREPGTVVRESDPVYTLSLASPVWIRAFVDEPNLGQIDYGKSVDVFTDTPNGRIYAGKVGFISPMAEFTPKTVETAQLRTNLVYRLRIYVDHPDAGLRQGMPVTVKMKFNAENK